jgi:hypothetical protein
MYFLCIVSGGDPLIKHKLPTPSPKRPILEAPPPSSSTCGGTSASSITTVSLRTNRTSSTPSTGARSPITPADTIDRAHSSASSTSLPNRLPTLPLMHLPSLLGNHNYYSSMFLHNPLLPPSLLYSHLYPNHFHQHLHNSELHTAVAAHLAAHRVITPRPESPAESDKIHPEDCTMRKASSPPSKSPVPNVTSSKPSPPRTARRPTTDVWRPY